MVTYGMIIDLTKCQGCSLCLQACKDEFVGNDWSPYSKPQPALGQFWINQKKVVRGQVPGKVKARSYSYLCNQCLNAPCISAAQNGAVYRRSDGIIIIDPVLSAGQKQIVQSCPYGVIYWNQDLNIPQKCTFCAHLLDNGWTQPRCVQACPTNALTFGQYSDLQPAIASAGAACCKRGHTGLTAAERWPRVYSHHGEEHALPVHDDPALQHNALF